jgi:hypothetical protein
MNAVLACWAKEAMELGTQKEFDGYLSDALAPEENFSMLMWWKVSGTALFIRSGHSQR